MVGICGIVGYQNSGIEELKDGLRYHGEENDTTYEDGQISIAYVDHPSLFEEQPVSVKDGEVLLWAWGNILGHERDGVYKNRSDKLTRAEYCAELYNLYGDTFSSGLNSEFSGVVYNRNKKTVSVFTDRLGSRPVYYTQTNNGSLVFSSLLQGLNRHPDVFFEYDVDYLSQFFTYSRSLGTSTPFQNVKILPPASITKFDLAGNQLESQTYWSPKVQPLDDSFLEIADRFKSVFTEAVRERASGKNKRDGLLLSGGSDSRAILAAYEGNLTAFHMNELTNNPESQIAKKIAETGGSEFCFLQRKSDYYSRVLEKSSETMGFKGLFHSAKTAGFSEELRSLADIIYIGHYSDTIIGDDYVPMSSKRRSKDIRSIREYVDEFDSGSMKGKLQPSFIRDLPDANVVIESNINTSVNGIKSHGVHYPSWKSLVEFGMVYPITNTRTYITYETLIHTIPTHYPFLDNRVINLTLQIPSEYRYRADLVGEIVCQLDPDLASIPHASTGVPLSDTSSIQKVRSRITENRYINHLLTTPVRELPTDFLDHIGLINKASGSAGTHVSSGSWLNKSGVIRVHPFVENKLYEHNEILNENPFVSEDDAWNIYHEHLDGKNNSYEIFSLLTFLEVTSNITQRD